MAVDAGADEIDMVIDRGAFLTGRYGQVYEEIVAVKEACGRRAHLKVILETGELAGYDDVRRASWLALLAGADVIKTSTGKISPAATLPVVQVMLLAVRDWHRATGELPRRQGRGRHPHGQGRDPPPRRRQRGGRAGVAHARALPLRRAPRCSATCCASAAPRPRATTRARATSGVPEMTWTYAPAPESAALANLQPTYRPFIDGEFVDGGGSR